MKKSWGGVKASRDYVYVISSDLPIQVVILKHRIKFKIIATLLKFPISGQTLQSKSDTAFNGHHWGSDSI